MPPDHSRGKEPFEIEARYLVAARDLDHAAELYDAPEDFADGIGLLSEGGVVSKMDRANIIDGSLLDVALSHEGEADRG